MPARSPATGESLSTILRNANEHTFDNSVVVRGLILNGSNPNEFVLRRYATSPDEYAIIDVSTVIGDPIPVPEHLLASDELGAPIFAVRMRVGTPVQHVREYDYHVGIDPMPVRIAADYLIRSADASAQRSAKLEDLLKASANDPPDYRAFPGVVRPGRSPDTICLDPSAPERGEIGLIKRADIVEPDAILRLPDNQLPIAKRGLPIHVIKIRAGATVRVFRQREVKLEQLTPPVGAQPAKPGCSCQSAAASSTATEQSEHSHGRQHARPIAAGKACVGVTGTCPWDGSIGEVCQSEGSYCGWITNSYCETRQGWWKNCYCDCHWE